MKLLCRLRLSEGEATTSNSLVGTAANVYARALHTYAICLLMDKIYVVNTTIIRINCHSAAVFRAGLVMW